MQMQPAKILTQRSTYREGLTPLQSLIYQLNLTKFKKAHSTFYALASDADLDKKNKNQLDFLNKYLLERFGDVCLGNQRNLAVGSWTEVNIESTIIWIKEILVNNKLIRLIYHPLFKWEITAQNAPKSFNKMAQQQSIFTHFLKPKLTDKHTLVSISYMSAARGDDFGGAPTLKIISHMESIFKEMVKIYKLDVPEVKQKVIYVVCIKDESKKMEFEGQIKKDKKIYVMANDGLFALDPKDNADTFKLKTEQTDLLVKDNFVQVAEIHKHFSYNEFFHLNQQMAGLNLPLKVSDELFAIFTTILHPIIQIKRRIVNTYSLALKENKNENKNNSWSDNYEIKANFRLLNEIFKFEEWKKSEQNAEEVGVKSGERLEKFTSTANLNVEFQDEDPKFIAAMIMTQINNFSLQLEEDNNLPKSFFVENRILEFGKITVRLLNSLKRNKNYSDLLVDFEPKFYEYLLTIYANAHDEFSRANKGCFDKLYRFMAQIRDLKSSKQELLKVLTFNENEVTWKRQQLFSLEETKRRRRKLEIELNLLTENKSIEEDKEITRKIFIVKFEYAMTLKKLAFELNFGDRKSRYLREALKIVFEELYCNMFLDNKNFATQYPNGIGITDYLLLEEASGLLKMMGRIDLSIEVQKNMSDDMKVAEYYKYSLMPLRRQIESDVLKMQKIINLAIGYFKTRHHLEYVSEFYDLLKRTARSKEEREKFEDQRMAFKREVWNQNNNEKLLDGVKNEKFPLLDQVLQDIKKVCDVNKEEKKEVMWSLLVEE